MQFYVIVLIPSVFFYQKRRLRGKVIGYQMILILASILYLSIATYKYDFSTLLTVDI